MASLRFFILVYLSLALAVAASDHGLHRRGHADLGRLVKKRAIPNLLDPAAQSSSVSPIVQSTQATPSHAQTTSANSAPVPTTSASPSAGPSTTSGGGLLSSILGGLQPTESSSTSSTRSSASSSISSASQPSSTPQTAAHSSDTRSTVPTQSTVFLTSSGAPTPTQTTSPSGSSGISHAAVTILIVIAVSVGASVIVWTIIRKWKFRPSSDFEGRMQPIDWEPGNTDDAGLSGHRRPSSRASSFHSGPANPPVDDMRAVGGYGAPTLNPIPDHDFTAGPAHLAPVGGYADLARGPSPQPVMQESYGGAPIINRPVQYDQYGVPLYHGYGGY